MALNPLGWLQLARAIDGLLGLETKLTAVVEAQKKEIETLKDRVTRLEAREEVLIAEAKAAASAAASAVASQHVAELARHVGALDERSRHLGRLSQPDSA